jgi:hypothetical protein
MALIEAAEELGETYHVGLAASVDSFYAGEVNPMPGGFWQSQMDTVLEDLTPCPRSRISRWKRRRSSLFAQLFGFQRRHDLLGRGKSHHARARGLGRFDQALLQRWPAARS